MSMTIADAIRLEGIAEGEARGEARGAQNTLLNLGRRKLGDPDAAALQTLRAITDVERLNRLSVALWDAASWTELLSIS